MKRMFKNIAIGTCAGFTIMTVCYLAAWFIFEGPNEYLTTFVSILGASVSCACLQAFWFYSPFVKKLSYALRGLGFSLMLFPVLLGCAWFGAWFPLTVGSVISFSIIFLVILAIMFVIYSIYFRKIAGSYEEALKAYREKGEAK